MSDNNQHNNNNNNNNNNQQGGRSGFPPNLGGGGVDHAMWAQAMAQQSQAKHNSGQTFNPADSTQLLASFRQLQQNNGGNPIQNQQNQNQNNSSSAAGQQQANILLQKALQEANARNGQLRGGGQLQIPSSSGQVGIAGQHALLQALLANNQHAGQQQQQFPGGPPSFNPNQPQFSLQLPNQHQQQQQQQQQQQHHNPQQQQQQQQNPQLNNGRQGANIPPAMVAILSNMGPQGTNMIKDWHQGNLSGEQMVQLKQLLAAHQSRQPKSTNMAQQQQSNQMANQNSPHERNASGSSQPPTPAQLQQQTAIVNMTNEQLGKVITSLTTKIKNLESSLANGQIPAIQVERAKVAMSEWTPQLRALVRESQARNLTLVQNGNIPNIHSSPNPAFNQPNPHQNQFANNGLPPNFNNSPNLQARPNPGASFNAPIDPSQQRTSFFKKLSEMFQRKGIQITSSPMVEGSQIDLFNLYAKVVQEGGSESVRARNLWPVVGAHLGLTSSSGPDGIPRSTPDTANQVADIFGTYLSAFEDAWKNPGSDARLLNQSPQLGQQQHQPQQQQPNQQQQQQQPQPHAPEINDAVLERLSQMPQAQRDSITLPTELSRRLEIYIAQKNANLANNNGSSPQVQPGAIGGQQNSATFAWARQQQQYAEASARASGNQPSSSMGGAVGGVPPRPASGGVGQQPGQDAPRPFTAPTSEETQKSKLVVASMIDQIVEKLRTTQKEVEGLSDEEKTEITTALRDLQGQIGEAEKRLTLFRIISHTAETTTACNRVTHMIAMWKNGFWNASQGRIIIGRNDIMTLRSQIGRFIQYVHTTVQQLMNRPQPNDQQRQLQQQQFLQQQQLQAQQQLQQAAALQQQQQPDQSQLASSLPDPSTFAGRLRPEDLRAPPPPKRARTSSVGGIASPSPAATTPAELRTPINAEQSPPANGKSPASSKKGTPKDSKSSLGGAANKKEKASAGNRKSSTSTGGRSTLDQVKEEMEKRVREEDVVEVPAQGPSVPSGVVATDPASVLGLQMDGWEERRRQEEVRAAAKDPVSFFQTQWNNLQQAQLDASNAGGVPNTFHDGGGPNGLDHTALARAMRDIRQPSTYGSSSSSYPIASTSSLPYNHLSYSSNPMQDSNQPASPQSPVEDAFDISFFLDASQYEDEEAEEEVAVPTEDDGGAANSQGGSSRKVGSSSSSDPRPIDAQTPDLLHSSGPHDESPASVKEAISPPRLLPFRSSTDTTTNATASSSNLSAPLTNRSAPNPFARTSTSAEESFSVLIPSSIPGDTNPSSAKSISPLPLQTPLAENGMEIWSEMGEDSYFSGGGVGGGFDWEGTQLEGTNGSSGWLINST